MSQLDERMEILAAALNKEHQAKIAAERKAERLESLLKSRADVSSELELAKDWGRHLVSENEALRDMIDSLITAILGTAQREKR